MIVMVKKIVNTFIITIKKQTEGYTIEANSYKGFIKVAPQPFPRLENLLSPKQLETVKALEEEESIATPIDIQQLGQALYQALFKPPILKAFEQTKHKSESKGNVRLKLNIEPSELAVLPWETMHDGENWLSTQSITPLVRQLSHVTEEKTLQKLQVKGALRILFVGASPNNMPGLDMEEIKATAIKLKS